MKPLYDDQLVAFQNKTLIRLLFGSAAIIMALAGVVVSFVLRPGPPPYVVAVNEHGQFLAVSKPVLGTDAVMPSVMRWVLSEYIQNAFRIERNRDDEILNLSNVYQISSPDSGKLLTAWYSHGNDPIMLGPKFHQQVIVTDILNLKTKDTYQVDFVTIRTPYAGDDGTVRTNYRATMQLKLARPTESDPLGIYVENLDFAPVVTQ